jgi:hypothetical protein
MLVNSLFLSFRKRHDHEFVTTEAEHGATAPYPSGTTPRPGGKETKMTVSRGRGHIALIVALVLQQVRPRKRASLSSSQSSAPCVPSRLGPRQSCASTVDVVSPRLLSGGK